MSYHLIPTGSTATLQTLGAAYDYANAHVSDGFASSYEIAETTGPIYGDTGFTVTFFRSVAAA